MEIYNHKQIGYSIIIIFLFSIIFSICINIFMYIKYHSFNVLIICSLIDLLLLVFLFMFYSFVTIIYDDGNLLLKFGLIKKKLNLKNAISFEKVTNPWYAGYGIKLMPNGGWSYNISGKLAVEIKFIDGKIYRIGTDEPENLILIIKKFIN